MCINYVVWSWILYFNIVFFIKKIPKELQLWACWFVDGFAYMACFMRYIKYLFANCIFIYICRQTCVILRLPDHALRRVFSYLDTRDLASIKCTCFDFNFIINYFDVRANDSRWTTDERYLLCVTFLHIHYFVETLPPLNHF